MNNRTPDIAAFLQLVRHSCNLYHALSTVQNHPNIHLDPFQKVELVIVSGAESDKRVKPLIDQLTELTERLNTRRN